MLITRSSKNSITSKMVMELNDKFGLVTEHQKMLNQFTKELEREFRV